jgi:hypothetical protein
VPTYIVDAARLIALRIRQYVPHRHTFMIWSMSASEGLGLDLSSAAACMICPGYLRALTARDQAGHVEPGQQQWSAPRDGPIVGHLSTATGGDWRCLPGIFHSLKWPVVTRRARPSKLVMRVRSSSPAP